MKALQTWGIEVIFINNYEDSFDKNEQVELVDSEYRFKLSIEKIINDIGIVPDIGDWIDPLHKPDYILDIGRIADRYFNVKTETIRFEIE